MATAPPPPPQQQQRHYMTNTHYGNAYGMQGSAAAAGGHNLHHHHHQSPLAGYYGQDVLFCNGSGAGTALATGLTRGMVALGLAIMLIPTTVQWFNNRITGKIQLKSF